MTRLLAALLLGYVAGSLVHRRRSRVLVLRMDADDSHIVGMPTFAPTHAPRMH